MKILLQTIKILFDKVSSRGLDESEEREELTMDYCRMLLEFTVKSLRHKLFKLMSQTLKLRNVEIIKELCDNINCYILT